MEKLYTENIRTSFIISYNPKPGSYLDGHPRALTHTRARALVNYVPYTLFAAFSHPRTVSLTSRVAFAPRNQLLIAISCLSYADFQRNLCALRRPWQVLMHQRQSLYYVSSYYVLLALLASMYFYFIVKEHTIPPVKFVGAWLQFTSWETFILKYITFTQVVK